LTPFLSIDFSSGRFFAANSVKLMLAHLLINYEIQPFDVRPINPSFSGAFVFLAGDPVLTNFADMQVVPRQAEMVIRRRVKA
jgi:hypothetical protein